MGIEREMEQKGLMALKSLIHHEIQRALSESQKAAISLGALIEKYVAACVADGKWQARAIPDHLNRVGAILTFYGDVDVNSLDRADLRLFRDTLRKLPPNWKRRCSQSGQDAQSLARENPGPTLSITSVNITVSAIAAMFAWGMEEGLLRANPARNLTLRDDQPAIDKRRPLSPEEIRHVFFAGDYLPENFSKPAAYWCPLLSLYTGMRLEETAQLHCADIYWEDNLAIVDIRPESEDGLEDKFLKTSNARRKIPLHHKLLELGLPAYVESLKSLGEIRLFPELRKTAKTLKYGKQVGKNFKALLLKKGINGNCSFHSLRHSFSNFFKKRNLHTDMFRQVFGHEIPGLAGRLYGERFSPREIYDELISKIDY